MSKIYLISPPKIELESFSIRLEKALKTGLVAVFQLRLKEYSDMDVLNISKKIKEICDANNCPFLINDYHQIALEIGASGAHIGVDDGSISKLRKQVGVSFIIGASCYDSKHLAMEAGEQGADYISFGAFFPTKTKESRGNPSVEIVEWCDEILTVPVVTIGGINNDNCASLIKAGADFISVISYVWDHPQGEVEALIELDRAIKAAS